MNYEIKKKYKNIAVVYLLDSLWNKIPLLDKKGRNEYDVQGNIIYEKRIITH